MNQIAEAKAKKGHSDLLSLYQEADIWEVK
jgi:hypothetical protein